MVPTKLEGGFGVWIVGEDVPDAGALGFQAVAEPVVHGLRTLTEEAAFRVGFEDTVAHAVEQEAGGGFAGSQLFGPRGDAGFEVSVGFAELVLEGGEVGVLLAQRAECSEQSTGGEGDGAESDEDERAYAEAGRRDDLVDLLLGRGSHLANVLADGGEGGVGGQGTLAARSLCGQHRRFGVKERVA